MKNEDYVKEVLAGQFPEDHKVPLDPPFTDNRGSIQNLWLGNSGSVTLIKSVKGAVRAKHVHKNGDWHAIYVLSGKVLYKQDVNEPELKETEFLPGQMFFTPPEVYHEVHMLEDTVFLTINGILKNNDNYENSIERPIK
jgi:quercetin dioxygenase-like cupin family protein